VVDHRGRRLLGPAIGLLLLSFPVAFFLFIVNTFPASRYLNPLIPFAALFAAYAVSVIARSISSRRSVICFWAFTAAAAAPALYQTVRTDLFFRRTDTRTIALREIAEETILPDELHDSLIGTLQKVQIDDDDTPDEIGSLSASAEALRLTAAAPPRNQTIGGDYDG
jgi:hypothetical protein